jgi:hypothetical protein
MPSAVASALDPERVELVTTVQRRRQWPLSEKLRAVENASVPGMTVSYVGRKYGIAPSLLFRWSRLMTGGEAKRLCGATTRWSRQRKHGNSSARFQNWNACWAKDAGE